MERTRLTIFITGGAGFVGTNLAIRYRNAGHKVVSYDNYSTGKKEREQEGVTYLNADIVDKDSLDRVLSTLRPDVIFHMAALARITPSFERPLDYFQTNANGTLNVVSWAASNKIPVIYAGSSSHHSGKFKNPYTFSKDAGEEIVELYQLHYKLEATIARFYNVYGQFHSKSGAYCTLLGNWENRLEKGEAPVLYGDGSKRRDFTHIDDIVDALVAIQEKECYGHTFELGRGDNYSVLEIAEMYDIVDRLVYKEDKPGEAQITLCDSNDAQLWLDWIPTRNVEDYIKKYVKENYDISS